MALNKTNASHFLRRTYPKKTRDLYSTKAGKLWAMLPRTYEGFGESYDVGMEFGGLNGAGADFTKARARAAASGASGSKFAVTELPYYSFAQVSGNLMRKAKASGEGMIKDRLVKASERAYRAFNHRMSRYCYGTGYTPLGAIDATTNLATNILVLTNPEDAINFEVNDVVGFAADLSTSAMKNGGAVLSVTKVDRNLGKITMSAVLNTVTGLALGDYIFVDGDRGTGASPTRVLPMGVGGWNPFTAPAGGDSHFGVNRSTDEVRLAGWRQGGLNKTPRIAVLDGIFQILNDRAESATVFCHPRQVRDIARDIEANKFWQSADLPSAIAGVSIKGAKWMTEWGEVNLVSDAYAPVNEIRILDLETWEYRGEGNFPDYLTFDDGNVITLESSDAGELRVGGDFELICHEPKRNLVIDMTQA